MKLAGVSATRSVTRAWLETVSCLNCHSSGGVGQTGSSCGVLVSGGASFSDPAGEGSLGAGTGDAGRGLVAGSAGSCGGWLAIIGSLAMPIAPAAS